MEKGLSEVTYVRLTPEVKAALNKYAAEFGVSLSVIMRWAIEKYIKDRCIPDDDPGSE